MTPFDGATVDRLIAADVTEVTTAFEAQYALICGLAAGGRLHHLCAKDDQRSNELEQFTRAARDEAGGSATLDTQNRFRFSQRSHRFLMLASLMKCLAFSTELFDFG